MLSEGLKCYFRDPIFQNLPRVHAPGPPWQLAPSVLGIAPPPCYGTAKRYLLRVKILAFSPGRGGAFTT